MKKMKKLFAILMTMAMVMGLGITGFAANLEIPEGTETATATVKGVSEEGATVTAYQLVSYNEETQEYVVATAAADKGYTLGARDAEVVSDIAKDTNVLRQLLSTTLVKQGSGDHTKDLPAGTYLILVTGAGTTIYNPMLVSLEVEYPNGVTDGEVDADSNYVVNDQIVYAKSTDEVKVDKIITDEDGNEIGENGKYEDVYTGTEVYFEITGTIPSYSEQYNNEKLTYTLTDTVSSGLTLDPNLQATLQTQVGADNATVTVNGNVITIAYKPAYIMAHGKQTVSIKYSATVNGTASNFNPATNTVEVDYSNSPSTITDGTPSTTNHYTFDIENALVKVDENNNEIKLEGAVFSLTSTTDSEKTFTAITDEDGFIKFSGLDAGTYTLTETKAPDGYQISGKEYTVKIDPVYENNELKSYTVTIEDPSIATGSKEIGKLTYTKENGNGSGNAAKIVNTTLASLPTTGGMGTTLFTIAGCVIMISAAGLFFATRKKAN